MEVLYYFGNEVNLSGNAVVNIQSELFEYPGKVSVFSSSQMTPPAIATHSVSNPNNFNTSISENFSNVNPFHFKYTAPNGCVYTGSFPGIPTCDNDPVDHFNFQVNHSGSSQGDCGPNQAHTYVLNDVHMGQNFPYFLEVTMVDAYAPNEGSYSQIIEFNSSVNSITVNGVPAGTVQFKTYNKCDDGLFLRTHVNCCGTLTCDFPLSQGTGSEYGGYQYWDFPYFRLQAEKSLSVCDFDGCGNWFEGDCARVIVNVHEGAAPEFNCWTGTVTITYPEGPPLVIKVIDGNPFDQVDIFSGPEGWAPSEPGAYGITINYVGSGASQGENCVHQQTINYYGGNNINDGIGFNSGLWWDISGWNIPSQFLDAYIRSWKCNTCEQLGDIYWLDNSGDGCENFNNYQSTFFKFVPDNPLDYFADNPCNTAGTLTVIEFDDNGVATFQEIPVPAGISSAFQHLKGHLHLEMGKK